MLDKLNADADVDVKYFAQEALTGNPFDDRLLNCLLVKNWKDASEHPLALRKNLSKLMCSQSYTAVFRVVSQCCPRGVG